MVVGRRGGICSGQEGGFGNCDRWFWGWVVLVLSAASLGWAGGDASLPVACGAEDKNMVRFCSGISPSFSPVMPLTRGASTLAGSRAPSSSSRFYRAPSSSSRVY